MKSEVEVVFKDSIKFFKHKNGMYFISPKKTEGLIKKEMKYHILKSEEDDELRFTAMTITKEVGHIIVSGDSLEEANTKFIEAFQMACVVGSLLNLKNKKGE